MSHAAALVDALGRDAVRIELAKDDGETVVVNRTRLDRPSWKWTS